VSVEVHVVVEMRAFRCNSTDHVERVRVVHLFLTLNFVRCRLFVVARHRSIDQRGSANYDALFDSAGRGLLPKAHQSSEAVEFRR